MARWEAGKGWVRPEQGSWGTPEHVRGEALRAFEAAAWADALAGFLALEELSAAVGAGASSTRGSDLNFYIAECYFHIGEYEQAIEYYRKVYRRDFPAPELLDQSLQRVYTIGMAYLHRQMPREFLGIISYYSPEFGVEILAGPKDGLITEYPMVSFADDALIEIARYYYEEKEYPEAVPVYDRVASDPDSEWADLAEFQAAMSVFRQIRGVDYDRRTIGEAESRFSAYLENHPRGDHTEESRERLREIYEMEGAKNLGIAKFYLRESEVSACELYLRRVLVKYPQSSAAEEAREIQRQLDRTKGAPPSASGEDPAPDGSDDLAPREGQ